MSFEMSRETGIVRDVNIIRVIDADSFVVDVYHSPRLVEKNTHLRLLFIDAPEKNTDAGQTAKSAVISLLNGPTIRYLPDGKAINPDKTRNGTIMFFTWRWDRYGRLLGQLLCDELDVGEWLLEKQLATFVGYRQISLDIVE